MAFDQLYSYHRTPMTFFDLETGGRDPDYHPILTIGMTTMDTQSKEVHSPLYIKVKWDEEMYARVEPGALAKNGINLEEHHNDPESVTFREANQIVNDYIRGLTPANSRYKRVNLNGHNIIGFDVPFFKNFQRNFDDLFFMIDDTMILARSLVRARRIPLSSVKLEDLCPYFGIEYDAHNALEDVQATTKLYIKLMDMLEGKL